MKHISVFRAGRAVGGSCALFYAGCAIAMIAVPHETMVRFINSIAHGWDVGPIMRWDTPWWEAIVGAIEIFILGWLFGALAAALYNFNSPTLKANGESDAD